MKKGAVKLVPDILCEATHSTDIGTLLRAVPFSETRFSGSQALPGSLAHPEIAAVLPPLTVT